MAQLEGIRCPLCENKTIVVDAAHPGYKLPATFVIVECVYCDVQFANPRRVDEGVYEDIYRNASELPGYSRYVRLSHSVAHSQSPLDTLAQAEDMYWFVREAIRRLRLTATDRIVEIGSGLGYLTFALRKAGFDARGIEISREAVDDARSRFGDWYREGDVTKLAPEDHGSASVVVMAEVIEHVEDPVELLRAVRNLLKPGGTALVTTPNKSSHKQGAAWETENPPVHLWWFSETTMRQLAQRENFDISFYDFSAFPILRLVRQYRNVTSAPNPPYLDADGRPRDSIARTRRVKTLVRRSVPELVFRARRDWRALTNRNRVGLQRSSSMGVVLRKPPDNAV